MDQWVSPKNIGKLPKLLSMLGDNITSDLTRGNVLWLALAILSGDLDEMTTETLPGQAVMWNGGSYYQANPYDTAALVDSSFNPYDCTITADMLNIRQVY